MPEMHKRGILLCAHGARDPRWAEPLAALAERVAVASPSTRVAVGYLEMMTPEIEAAVDALVAAGCTAVTVVPVFLGQGGHVREDVPRRVAAAAARHPGVEARVCPAVGEDPGVLDAIAAYCLQAAAAA